MSATKSPSVDFFSLRFWLCTTLGMRRSYIVMQVAWCLVLYCYRRRTMERCRQYSYSKLLAPKSWFRFGSVRPTFRLYLQGKCFKTVIDCNSLIMTLDKEDMIPSAARWCLEFQDYEGNSFVLVICQNRDLKLVKLKDIIQMRQSKMLEMRNIVLYRKTNKNDRVFFCVPTLWTAMCYTNTTTKWVMLELT